MISGVVEIWIDRSNGAPLSYSLRCNLMQIKDMRYHSDVERIVAALVSQQHRWRDMVISCEYVQFSARFTERGVALTRMPMLDSLMLVFDLLGFFIDIEHSPRLRYIRGAYE